MAERDELTAEEENWLLGTVSSGDFRELRLLHPATLKGSTGARVSIGWRSLRGMSSQGSVGSWADVVSNLREGVTTEDFLPPLIGRLPFATFYRTLGHLRSSNPIDSRVSAALWEGIGDYTGSVSSAALIRAAESAAQPAAKAADPAPSHYVRIGSDGYVCFDIESSLFDTDGWQSHLGLRWLPGMDSATPNFLWSDDRSWLLRTGIDDRFSTVRLAEPGIRKLRADPLLEFESVH